MNYTDPAGLCMEDEPSIICVESDVENEKLEGHPDVASSDELDKIAVAGADKVAVPSGVDEKLGYIKDGGVSVVSDTKVDNSPDDYNAAGSVPSDADAVIHGHPDGSQAGVVSRGDALIPLDKKMPNYVVHDGRAGVTEIVGGKLQFRMVKGEMSKLEARHQKIYLNKQLRDF